MFQKRRKNNSVFTYFLIAFKVDIDILISDSNEEKSS